MSWAQSLIKLTAYEAEGLQQRLAAIAERRRVTQQQLHALDVEAAVEAARAQDDAQAGWYLVGFREGLKQRRRKLEAELMALDLEEDGCRDALQASFEAKKKYEQVEAAAARARAQAAAARETVEMDAAALRAASRKPASARDAAQDAA
jgi:flagellar FliJ protein